MYSNFLGPAGVGSVDCCLLLVTLPLSTGILLNSCSNYVSELFCVISKSYVLYSQFILVTGSFPGFRLHRLHSKEKAPHLQPSSEISSLELLSWINHLISWINTCASSQGDCKPAGSGCCSESEHPEWYCWRLFPALFNLSVRWKNQLCSGAQTLDVRQILNSVMVKFTTCCPGNL